MVQRATRSREEWDGDRATVHASHPWDPPPEVGPDWFEYCLGSRATLKLGTSHSAATITPRVLVVLTFGLLATAQLFATNLLWTPAGGRIGTQSQPARRCPMRKNGWGWSKTIDRLLAGIPAVITLLQFIDPTSRAARWIPAWTRNMNAELDSRLLLPSCLGCQPSYLFASFRR